MKDLLNYDWYNTNENICISIKFTHLLLIRTFKSKTEQELKRKKKLTNKIVPKSDDELYIQSKDLKQETSSKISQN